MAMSLTFFRFNTPFGTYMVWKNAATILESNNDALDRQPTHTLTLTAQTHSIISDTVYNNQSAPKRANSVNCSIYNVAHIHCIYCAKKDDQITKIHSIRLSNAGVVFNELQMMFRCYLLPSCHTNFCIYFVYISFVLCVCECVLLRIALWFIRQAHLIELFICVHLFCCHKAFWFCVKQNDWLAFLCYFCYREWVKTVFGALSKICDFQVFELEANYLEMLFDN